MGIQAIASRAVIRDADLRWVFIGCVVPDVPWILNRVLTSLMPELDVFVVRPYWIAQASLLGLLWLCGAAGADLGPAWAYLQIARRKRRRTPPARRAPDQVGKRCPLARTLLVAHLERRLVLA
jgi:hypothetical protein